MNQMNKMAVAVMLFTSLFFNSQICFGEGIEQKLEVKENLKFVKYDTFGEMYSQEQVIEEPKQRMVSRGLPRGISGEFKSYMSFKSITNKSSEQYRLQSECWSDEYGFRRWGDYYCVALGSRYSTNIGSKFKITFDTGVEIYAILADCKSDKHTDRTNSYNPFNNNICEFIVDMNSLDGLSKKMGDISYSPNGLMGGKIVKIQEIIE